MRVTRQVEPVRHVNPPQPPHILTHRDKQTHFMMVVIFALIARAGAASGPAPVHAHVRFTAARVSDSHTQVPAVFRSSSDVRRDGGSKEKKIVDFRHLVFSPRI